MIGGLIGAGLGLAASVFSGVKGARMSKEAVRAVKESINDNDLWHMRRYNEDATQRADTRRLLNITADNLRRAVRHASGLRAVGGGSAESEALARRGATEAMAQAVSSINADNERRRDAIDATHQSRRDRLRSMLMQLKMGRSQNMAKAVSEMAAFGSNLSKAF